MNINLISPLLFYLVPFLIGRGIIGYVVALIAFLKQNAIKDKKSNFISVLSHTSFTLPYPFVTYYILGSSLIYALALIIQYAITPLFQFSFTDLFFPSVLSTLMITIWGNLLIWRDISLNKYIAPLTIACVSAPVIYLVWQHNSPYPFNWDIYEHQTLVNSLFQGRFSYITTQITDTFGFNGYSSFFHTLVYLSQSYEPTRIFDFWHGISMIHFMIVIFTSYVLAHELTDNKKIAVLSTLFTMFFFDSSVTFTTLFFIPQTYTAVLFILLFSQLLASIKRSTPLPLILVIGQSFFLLINHYIIGSAAVGIYLAAYVYFTPYGDTIRNYFEKKNLAAWILYAGFLFILFSSYIPLGFLNKGEGGAFTYSLEQKFSIMRQIYGYFLLIFLPIGMIEAYKKKNTYLSFTLVITLMLGILSIAILPYTLKFFTLTRFFVDVFFAIAVYTLVQKLSNRILQITAVSVLVLALLIIFLANIVYWKNYLYYETITTHVSPNEIAAAEWLKQTNASSNTLLISDPATQYILETLSGVNSQGGAYADTSTRSTLDQVSKTNNSTESARLLANINDKLLPTDKRLFVMSGRYFIWQDAIQENKLSLAYNVWYPADLTLQNYRIIDEYQKNSQNFRLIYQNSSLVIFELK